MGHASGPDNISNRVLKECAISLAFPLHQLINYSFSTGEFPNSWKYSNTCPIYKSSEKFIKTNYRPVSLLSNLSKVTEMVAFKHLYLFCKHNNILTWRNFGFKELDSTILQCLHISSYLYEQLDRGHEVCMVFLDVSKAFDRVWHDGLLYKLCCIGVKGNFFKWFQSYLKNRKQRVVIKGQSSKWYNVNAGVPQGSVLGPLLFLIYVNDIVDDISSNISLFADDTSLYRTITSSDDIDILNSDLNTISKWGKKWLVNFNARKTLYMLFSKRKKPLLDFDLLFENVVLEREVSHKHLGICFDSNLTWNSHINNIIEKTSSRLNIMKRIQRKVPRVCLENIYEHMILPIIEYGDVIYDNLTKKQSNDLEQVQRQAALACSGGYRHTKYESLLIEIGWAPLHARRKCHRLNMLYKIVNDLTPPYVKCIFPDMVFERPVYNLRSRNNLNIPKYNKSFSQNSFVPKTIKDWNMLPQNIVTSGSYDIFKRCLKDIYFTEKNQLYRWSNGPSYIHLARFRMGLSGLNKHRYLFNFIDSPDCLRCTGKSEDVAHYLLDCPRYVAQRDILFTQLAPILPDIVIVAGSRNILRYEISETLIKGSCLLSNDQNLFILKTVQQYITSTKRFL